MLVEVFAQHVAPHAPPCRAELASLRSITCLNLSDNSLGQFPSPTALPPSLTELNLTGCGISSLPDSLGRFSKLKRLHVGANR